MASGKLRIGVDCDDVIADLHTPWVNRLNQAHGLFMSPQDMRQWDFYKDWGLTAEDAYKELTPDIYKEVKPVEGALDALKQIQELGHEPVIVTTCHTFAAYEAKVDWFITHGFFAFGSHAVGPWAQYASKSDPALKLDWLVDDHIGNLEGFPGYPILVTRSHNRLAQWHGKRVKNLGEVVALLKNYPADQPANGWLTPPGEDTCEVDLCRAHGHPGSGERVRYEQDKSEFLAAVAASEAPAVRQFETGATRDTETGKLDYEAFFSPAVLKRRAEFMHKNRFQRDGSLRDGDNWQKGIPVDAYMKSLARHFMTIWGDYRAGKPLPQEEVCALMFNAEGLLYEDLKTAGA
jgi:5'(3')-deoxyribonucleotidase